MRFPRMVMVLGLVSVAVCSDPKPTTGTLIVDIEGLPSGAAARVNVIGPNGFLQTLTSTNTLENLPPGPYVVSPAVVKFTNALYSATPSVSKTIVAGKTENASVAYSLGSGSINLNVTGLPTDVGPRITVSGSTSRVIFAPGVIEALPVGTYTLTIDTL